MAAEDTGLSPCCRHPEPPAPGAPTTHHTLLASQPSPGTRLPAGRGCLHPTGPCVPKAGCSPEGGRRAVLREPCGVHHPAEPTDPFSQHGEGGFGQAQRSVCSPLDVTAGHPAMQGPRCPWATAEAGLDTAHGHCPVLTGDEKASAKGGGSQQEKWGCRGSGCPLGPPPQRMEVVGDRQSWWFLSQSRGAGEVGRFVPVRHPSTRVGPAVKQPEPPFPSVVGRAGTHYTTSVPLPSPPAPRMVPPAAGSQRDWGTIAPRSQPLPTAKQELPMSQWGFKPAAVPSSPG